MASGIESTSSTKTTNASLSPKTPKTATRSSQDVFAKSKQSLFSEVISSHKKEVDQLANQVSKSTKKNLLQSSPEKQAVTNTISRNTRQCSGRPCHNEIISSNIPLNKQSPINVTLSWLSGSKGNVDFLPGSNFSNEFSKGQGARAFENYVYKKFNGNPSKGDFVTNYDYKYKWDSRIFNLNTAVQVVGSFQDGTAYIGDKKIYFSVKNTIGTNSLLFGRQLSEAGLSSYGSSSNDLKMTISWTKPLRHSK